MPVFKAGPNQAPEWAEMEQFDIVELKPGETHVFPRIGQREKLIVGKGWCHVAWGVDETNAREGANLDIGPDRPYDCFKVVAVLHDTTVIRMAGHWGEETGGSGIFAGPKVDVDEDRGDAVSYEKRTGFDCHYHDCNEYWLIFKGKAKVVTEGEAFYVKPGDIVCTQAGEEHDMTEVYEDVEAFYFEDATLEGGRTGHLHRDKTKAEGHEVSSLPLPSDFPE